MSIEPTTLPVRSGEDVVKVRQAVRTLAMDLGFSLVDQTKVITAASELARNTLTYGGGGECRIERLNQGPKRAGVRLTFEDRGPGITNLDLALTDGYTTGNGLGLGLNGARKLSHEFDIWSQPGVGTRVTITRWK
ncbi:anti-sigma regulatory factor [Peristeroidobacter soli]|jgi:serine/threonine-protein kinase RsbT|uniref:anti-sigma regulatory factor n=1 Tax=Peristeroidobacter soli TaxID=2497877 RepID=UPI00101CBC82|nr:anti-sigma regulatory factor [Peristeroidobacter soli]